MTLQPEQPPGNFGAAYHEAGHAIVIALFDLWNPGWRIVLPGEADAKRLGIGGSVLPLGRSLGDPDPPPCRGRFLSRGDTELDIALRRCAAREGIMDLAGCWAQFPRSRAWSPFHGHASLVDRSHAWATFNEFGFDPVDPWSTLNEATIEVVDANWGLIESIALGLHLKREMSADEVIERIEAWGTEPRRNPYRERAPVWDTVDPVEFVAESLKCWRREDWVQEDERAAAMNAVDS